MKQFGMVTLLVLSVLGVSLAASATDIVLEKILPSPACAPGWVMDGKVVLYDKETLSDRINGEAELFFPYGFTYLISARYANKQNPRIAIDADVYKMGSLLDAFGMYANYRRKDDAAAIIGNEGSISSSQLFFYQDQYLVRLQATGTTSLEQGIFLVCGKAISQNLPSRFNLPQELEPFSIPAVVRKSERYIARSLLGYDFFRRGLIADAMLGSEQVQVFVVLEDSRAGASKAFDQYSAYLKTSGMEIRTIKPRLLNATDPLYGNVVLEQSDRYLVGVIRFKNVSLAEQLVDQIRKRLRNE
jgi:hypothetical protein